MRRHNQSSGDEESDLRETNNSLKHADQNTEKNRKLKCSCGRAYQSEASLKNHAKKTNHQITEIFPKKSKNPKKGRPKKEIEINGYIDKNNEYASLTVLQTLTYQLSLSFKTMERFLGKNIILTGTLNLSFLQVRKQLEAFGHPKSIQLLNESKSFPQINSNFKQLSVYFLSQLNKHFDYYPYSQIVIFFDVLISCYQEYPMRSQSFFEKNENQYEQFLSQFTTKDFEQYLEKNQVDHFYLNRLHAKLITEAFTKWLQINKFILSAKTSS